ncbi:hypothetical protein PENDEC_c041G01999 [Penicillium decumbens]|uniref:Peptidase S1 domain-containing protein n=1 Tax=Penicillium decumbens TaxID=69771 RepID=A0A1V6NRU5_PENDC|nr:hypothetical protein PENDEC_c041G01999 [Penicillium decumbens]
MGQIRDCLGLHNFPDTTYIQTLTASKPGYPGGDSEIDLLRVSLNDTNSSPLSFGDTKDDLIQILRDNNHPEVHVEIINLKLHHHPSFFYLSNTSPLVLAYERAKERIIQALDRVIPKKWHVLCPFSVGRVEGKALPAIAVIVTPRTKADWFSLRVEIMTLTSPYSEDSPIDVEFLPGSLDFLDSPGMSSLDPMKHSVVPRMGFSIGIHGQETTGTLGGWVNLTHKGVLHQGFLTNSHVTRPSPSTVYDNGFLNDLDRFGVTFDRPPSKPIRIESLAKIDRDKTVAEIVDGLETLEVQKIQMMTKIEERELMGADPRPGHQTLLRAIDDQISQLAAVRGPAEAMPTVVGDLVLASGKPLLGTRMMDWAFVRVSEPGRKFFGPNLMFDIPEYAKTGKYIKNVVPWRPDTVIEELGALQDGQFCTKIGRTTGVTSGICNGPKAICNWGTTRWNEHGDAMDLSTYRTEEFIVISKKLKDSEFQQSDFADRGDSGSFVLDELGVVNGLLFASVIHNHGFAGVVSSMADVIESIRQKLGGDVTIELPV